MSILRDAASDDEFRETIRLRVANSARTFHGVSALSCTEVRRLLAQSEMHGREVGDRLYYVLDTDICGRPHHADIFATLPRESASAKAAWRVQRSRLMQIVERGLVPASEFRNGLTLPE
jgi:hypothetical protein